MRRVAFLAFVVGAFAGSAFAAETTGWKGSIDASLSFVEGNRNTDSVLIIGKMKQVGTNDRKIVDGLYNFSRQTNNLGNFETSTDLWSLGGRYERDFGNKSFWYVSARFDRDGVNDLNLRQVYGAGLGYTMFANDVSTWRISVGASQVLEDYQSGNTDYFGLQATSDYTRQLDAKLSLEHSFLYVPNVDDFEDYFFVSSLGLSYKLNERMKAGFRWIVNFDATPSAGSRKQNRTYAFTLGYSF